GRRNRRDDAPFGHHGPAARPGDGLRLGRRADFCHHRALHDRGSLRGGGCHREGGLAGPEGGTGRPAVPVRLSCPDRRGGGPLRLWGGGEGHLGQDGRAASACLWRCGGEDGGGADAGLGGAEGARARGPGARRGGAGPARAETSREAPGEGCTGGLRLARCRARAGKDRRGSPRGLGGASRGRGPGGGRDGGPPLRGGEPVAPSGGGPRGGAAPRLREVREALRRGRGPAGRAGDASAGQHAGGDGRHLERGSHGGQGL
ncbi:MAG: Nucleoside triphosphate pyrophosphohydrolase MazG, partial [uncultured Rubellimicrobium sp.]